MPDLIHAGIDRLTGETDRSLRSRVPPSERSKGARSTDDVEEYRFKIATGHRGVDLIGTNFLDVHRHSNSLQLSFHDESQAFIICRHKAGEMQALVGQRSGGDLRLEHLPLRR